MKKFNILASITLALIALAAVGCNDWERTTFQALAASKATIDTAQTDYEASASTGTCAAGTACLPHSAQVFNAITAAKAAQTAAVNQMVSYETLKAQGATSDKLAVAQSAVATALADIPPLITAIRALYTGGK